MCQRSRWYLLCCPSAGAISVRMHSGFFRRTMRSIWRLLSVVIRSNAHCRCAILRSAQRCKPGFPAFVRAEQNRERTKIEGRPGDAAARTMKQQPWQSQTVGVRLPLPDRTAGPFATVPGSSACERVLIGDDFGERREVGDSGWTIRSENAQTGQAPSPKPTSENRTDAPAAARRARPPVALPVRYRAILAHYTNALRTAPLADRTRRTYTSKVRQYLGVPTAPGRDSEGDERHDKKSGAPRVIVGDSGPGFGAEQGVWRLAPRVELARTSRDRVVALAESQIQG